MDDQRIAKQALQGKFQTVRGNKVDGKKLEANWKNVVGRDLQKMELGWKDAETVSTDTLGLLWKFRADRRIRLANLDVF